MPTRRRRSNGAEESEGARSPPPFVSPRSAISLPSTELFWRAEERERCGEGAKKKGARESYSSRCPDVTVSSSERAGPNSLAVLNSVRF